MKTDFDVIVIGAGFAGLYALYGCATCWGSRARVRSRRRRRRDLVLESLSGRALRFRELHLQLFVLEGARAGVGVVQQVSGAAGDPALPEPRRRSLRPAPRHRARDARRRGSHRRGGRTCWQVETAAGERMTRAVSRDRRRLPLGGERAEDSGPRALPGPLVHTGQWPPRASTSADKRVGLIGTGSTGIQATPRIAAEASHLRLSAHAQLHDPRPQPAADARGLGGDQGDLPRDPPACPRRTRRLSLHARGRARARLLRRRAQRRLRSALAGGWLQVPLRVLRRHPGRQGGQRDRFRVRPRQDPRDREGSRDRAATVSHRPPLRLEAPADRHATTSTRSTAPT